MRLVHVELKEANAFVERLHRHCKPVLSHRFSLGVEKDGELVGVAICGRPVARKTCQHSVVEVSRLCTDGTRNACSFLYGASARAAKALGFHFVQTWILDEEPGTSLKAAGWSALSLTPGKGWSVPTRLRLNDPSPRGTKRKYFKRLTTDDADPATPPNHIPRTGQSTPRSELPRTESASLGQQLPLFI